MRTLLALVLAAAAIAVPSAGAGTAAKGVGGAWVGSYSLGGAGTIAFTLSGRRAVVALGVGHAGAQAVAAATSRGRVRFQLPGSPAPLVFDGRLRKGVLRGTVRQGAARGTFRARRGRSPALLAPGLYDAGGRTLALVDDPYGPARLVDLGSGEVRAVYRSGNRFDIGSGFATRTPVQGAARFEAGAAVVDGQRAPRLAIQQLEVRFPSGGVILSGTLSMPAGSGPHAAVAFVHGSGPTTRSYLPELTALLVRNGVAVLNYDKRGTGQSRGAYPGESPTAEATDVLARDAAAAVRFLASVPRIDPARVGLTGHSQAGMIAPLAASREAAIRFLLLFAGPTVTADEIDAYQNLTGQGETPQQLSDQEIDSEVLRRGPGGVDPMPWIRSLRIPAFWIFGGLDKHIPTRLSMRQLQPLDAEPGREFSVAVFPRANHALVETQTGLTAEMLRSSTYAPGLFARVTEWLRSHRLTADASLHTSSMTTPAVADVRALAQELRTVHPDLFHAVSREAFDAHVDDLERRAGGLDEDELTVELMRLAALPAERDGHTGIFPLDPGHRRQLHAYPVFLYEFSDGFFVVAQVGGRAHVGKRVLAVAGVPIESVVARVRPLVPHDNEWSRRNQLPEYLVTAEVLHGLGIAPRREHATFTLAARDGTTTDASLAPVTARRYRSALAPLFHPAHRARRALGGLPRRSRPIYLARRRLDRWIAVLDRGRTVFAGYNVTQGTGSLGPRLRELASRPKVRRVVVDLRHNSGGDNTTYGPLLDALRSRRINRAGRLYVVIGRATFSAAGNLATEIDARTRAVLVGEPTGGAPNQYGDSAGVVLPESGLQAHVATRWWQFAARDDVRLAVEPDLPVALSSADFFAGRDPALAAIRRASGG